MTKKQKKIIKKFKSLRSKASKIASDLDGLDTDLVAVNKTASVSTRHTYGTDALTVVDAAQSSSTCGPFV